MCRAGPATRDPHNHSLHGAASEARWIQNSLLLETPSFHWMILLIMEGCLLYSESTNLNTNPSFKKKSLTATCRLVFVLTPGNTPQPSDT